MDNRQRHMRQRWHEIHLLDEIGRSHLLSPLGLLIPQLHIYIGKLARIRACLEDNSNQQSTLHLTCTKGGLFGVINTLPL